jgi:hypothetical protein
LSEADVRSEQVDQTSGKASDEYRDAGSPANCLTASHT